MKDDRSQFDDVLADLARDYNAPPETPKDLMWARIDAVRQERAQRRQQLRILYSPWTRWGVAVAAALAIGVGIGRLSFNGGPGSEPLGVSPEGGTSVEAPAMAGLAYRVAATQHLSQAETFLASFRADPSAGGSVAEFGSSAMNLLSSTRLLLDSPAADDPVFRALLEDLELVLVQIVQLGSYEDGNTEIEILTEGLERGGLLPRLRSAIPAGPVVGLEGA